MIALLALPLLFATPAFARAPVSLEGTWVSAEARRLLQSGQSGDPGCYLKVSAEGSVVESCADGVRRWPRVSESVTATAAELRSEGADGVRRAVVRAGAPAEMELRIEAGDSVEFRRLYRLDPRHSRELGDLVLVRDRLLGEWTTEDGVSLRFGGDGTYVFGGDAGRYRLKGGFLTPGGAQGVLYLQPESGGPTRRYLLHGRGHRLGLAEIPLDVELLLPDKARQDEFARGSEGSIDAAVEEGEEPQREPGTEVVVVEGVRIPLPEEEDEPVLAVLPPGVEEPEPRIWLDRAIPPAEEIAKDEGEVHGDEEGEEPPPIAQPIRPARRCGCQAAEATAGLILVGPWLGGRSRRRS